MPGERDETFPDAAGSGDPFVLFGTWFAEAGRAEPNDPNAMVLATVDATGMPNARVKLMKGYNAQGFMFYTNAESAKREEARGAWRAAVVFH